MKLLIRKLTNAFWTKQNPICVLYVRLRWWQLRHTCLSVLRYGSVRDIQKLGQYFLEAGKDQNCETYFEIGEFLIKDAEQFILKRIDL